MTESEALKLLTDMLTRVQADAKLRAENQLIEAQQKLWETFCTADFNDPTGSREVFTVTPEAREAYIKRQQDNACYALMCKLSRMAYA